MTNAGWKDHIGTRIKAARRQRGYRTAREFADAVPAENVTASAVENIESGRRADMSISQFLNIARALDVPPSMLLAPMNNPSSPLDLHNLSDDFDGMTSAEFDCWLSAAPASHYQPRLAAERADIDILNLLRELGTLRRELDRLQIVLDVHTASADPDLIGYNAEVQDRVERIKREARRIGGLLAKAGLVGIADEPASNAIA